MQQYKHNDSATDKKPKAITAASTINTTLLAQFEQRINSQQIIIEQQARSIRRLQSQLEQIEQYIRSKT